MIHLTSLFRNEIGVMKNFENLLIAKIKEQCYFFLEKFGLVEYVEFDIIKVVCIPFCRGYSF